jgi:hypothetical protein
LMGFGHTASIELWSSKIIKKAADSIGQSWCWWSILIIAEIRRIGFGWWIRFLGGIAKCRFFYSGILYRCVWNSNWYVYRLFAIRPLQTGHNGKKCASTRTNRRIGTNLYRSSIEEFCGDGRWNNSHIWYLKPCSTRLYC